MKICYANMYFEVCYLVKSLIVTTWCAKWIYNYVYVIPTFRKKFEANVTSGFESKFKKQKVVTYYAPPYPALWSSPPKRNLNLWKTVSDIFTASVLPQQILKSLSQTNKKHSSALEMNSFFFFCSKDRKSIQNLNLKILPVSMLQILKVLSQDTEAKYISLGKYWQWLTTFVWPINVFINIPSSNWKIFIVKSQQAQAISFFKFTEQWETPYKKKRKKKEFNFLYKKGSAQKHFSDWIFFMSHFWKTVVFPWESS